MALFDDMDTGVSGSFAFCKIASSKECVKKSKLDSQFDFDSFYDMHDLLFVSRRKINADIRNISCDKFCFCSSDLRSGLRFIF